MAHMSRQVRTNEATAAFRTVTFRAINDDGTAKTDLAAATAKIRTNGGSGSNSTNNFAHTSDGYYDLILTQAEVNLTVGYHLAVAPVSAAGYNLIPAEVIIAPSTAFDTGLTAAEIAAAVNDDAIQRLDGMTASDTEMEVDGTPFDITRDADGFVTSMALQP